MMGEPRIVEDGLALTPPGDADLVAEQSASGVADGGRLDHDRCAGFDDCRADAKPGGFIIVVAAAEREGAGHEERDRGDGGQPGAAPLPRLKW
jgi:hypothetical protein